jgi:ribosomal protein S18 acetylase RimI-like enzyme
MKTIALAAPVTENQVVVIRPYQPADYGQIKQIMQVGFADLDGAHAKEDEMNLMHHLYERGQMVATVDNQVVAICTSRIVPYHKYVRPHTQADCENTQIFEQDAHNGNAVYGLDIVVNPAFQNLKLGKKLVDQVVKHTFEDGFYAFIGMSRITNYANHSHEMSCKTYFDKVKNRELSDPVLGFHLRNGMEFAAILPQYSLADKASAGYGIMLRILNPNYNPAQQANRLFKRQTA